VRPFVGYISEREPSILFTVARSLIMDSCSFFPWEDHRFVQGSHSYHAIPLYYNPLINMILEKCEYNDATVYRIIGNTWVVWYPLDSVIEDIQATNEVLEGHGYVLDDTILKNN